ncbi:hypothetical protein [Marinococcus luteus]|uniref:hypothetical protein n=1 Tax=Marinococcus luteus TaxID=1122204 RepID=UPI002ACC799A|nr:hypothetical protein [Marinococcus luteus]MDZ5782046.1 hypothetical protein [Marinococcus luteus]
MLEKLAYAFCWLLLLAGFSFYTPWMPFGWSIYDGGIGAFILIVINFCLFGVFAFALALALQSRVLIILSILLLIMPFITVGIWMLLGI